ncbi:hypothetical protein E4O98_23280 [Pseudomonas sp. W2Jun17]|nr:hypothetical protein [Pseudomonas sp. W2Jun17]
MAGTARRLWPRRSERIPGHPVGASLLAKNVNDNACFLNTRGAYDFSRASSLLQWGGPFP